MSDELQEYKSQLELVEEGLQAAPDDESLKELKSELLDLIGMMEEAEGQTISLPEQHVQLDTNENTQERSKSPLKVSFSSSDNVPAQNIPVAVKPSPASHKSYSIGQSVLALDPTSRQFQPAKITLIAGSSSDSSYTVKFVKSAAVATLKEYQVREMNANRGLDDRKKAGSAEPGVVKHQPSKAKILDNSKNKWQAFSKNMGKRKGGEPLASKSGGVSKHHKSGITQLPKANNSRTKNLFNSSTRIG